MKNIISIFLILLVFCIQLVSGINYILFPLTLNDNGYSSSFIGIAMSFEVLAIILFCHHIPSLISKLGPTKTIIGTALLRGLVVLMLGANHTALGWFVGIFVYGFSTSMILVLLQTWINMLSLGKWKGLILGLYSSALSMGVAMGPLLLHLFPENMEFQINACLTLIPLLLLGIHVRHSPAIGTGESIRFKFIFHNAKIIMLSALVGGICFFGLPSFLTLYGLNNGLAYNEASFLLPMFMIGSIGAGAGLSALSSFVNRMKLIYYCVFTSVICAVFLALAVYAQYEIALILLLIWGGCMGGLYAVGLEYIGQTFMQKDQMSANTAFVFMDALGGFVGLCVIGASTDVLGTEGLTYPIIIASTSYLIFITVYLTKRIRY